MSLGRWVLVLWGVGVVVLYGLMDVGRRWVRERNAEGAVEWISWGVFVERHLGKDLDLNTTLDFPLRPPDGDGVRIARPFGVEGHLGEDWNAGYKDEDLGEPVYSPGDGLVTLAMDFEGAWGKVVMVLYKVEWEGNVHYVEMMFAHLDAIYVEPFSVIPRGKLIGAMGNCNGLYATHLHWEVRLEVGLGLGGGYCGEEGMKGWVSGSDFVSKVRGKVGKYTFLNEGDWDAWGSD